MGLGQDVFPAVALTNYTIEWLQQEQEKGKRKKAVYKLKVKNGDVRYKLNSKGQYVSKRVDYVAEFDRLTEALSEFLAWVDDDLNNNKVTLTLIPKGGKK